MKRYTRHNCTKQHRTARTFTRCIWPNNEWILGAGEYASVSYCRWRPTIVLHRTAQEAHEAVAVINALACGGRCTRRHQAIQIVLSAPLTRPGRRTAVTTGRAA